MPTSGGISPWIGLRQGFSGRLSPAFSSLVRAFFRVTKRRGRAGFDPLRFDCYDEVAGWSSLVARWAHNPKVGGSNPPPATIYGIRQPQITPFNSACQNAMGSGVFAAGS